MGNSSCASGRSHVAMVPRWNCTTLLLAAVLTHFAPSVGADVPTLMQSISSEIKAIHRVDAAAATSTGGAVSRDTARILSTRHTFVSAARQRAHTLHPLNAYSSPSVLTNPDPNHGTLAPHLLLTFLLHLNLPHLRSAKLARRQCEHCLSSYTRAPRRSSLR